MFHKNYKTWPIEICLTAFHHTFITNALPMWICEELVYRNVSKYILEIRLSSHKYTYRSIYTAYTQHIHLGQTRQAYRIIYTAYIYISYSQIFQQAHLEGNIVVAYCFDPWLTFSWFSTNPITCQGPAGALGPKAPGCLAPIEGPWHWLDYPSGWANPWPNFGQRIDVFLSCRKQIWQSAVWSLNEQYYLEQIENWQLIARAHWICMEVHSHRLLNQTII